MNILTKPRLSIRSISKNFGINSYSPVNNQTKKLKEFVTRNEAYIESSEWLTDQINIMI